MMKTLKIYIIPVVVLLALVLASCGFGPAQPVVNQYETLITLYQKGQRGASSFRLCYDTSMGKIVTTTTQFQMFANADIEKVRAWRDVLNQSVSQGQALTQAYNDPTTGQPIPASQLDLGALQQAGALPNNMGSSFALVVHSVQEAPLAAVSEKMGLAMMDTTNESYNSLQACGEDWNSTAEAYNIERNKVSGDVVGSIADRLGVKTLPEELLYYQGTPASGGSVTSPLPQVTSAP